MGGNIGLPILAQDPLPEGGVYVLELSSYQLDLTQSLKCDIAVLLNITPDHLDRYESFEAYAASKARLFEMSTGHHIGSPAKAGAQAGEAVVGVGGKDALRATGLLPSQENWRTLQGPHNAENAAAALAVSKALGLNENQVERAFRTYPGLPHRMERIREKDRV